MNVHLLHDYPHQTVAYLESLLDPAICLTAGTETDPAADYHILIAGRPKRELLATHDNLHTLIIPWTGLPPETASVITEFPQISVHNIHHNAVPVAEMAVALMLAAAKMVIPFDRALRDGDWRMRYSRPAPVQGLNGKTVLILGFGEIGRHAAQICRAMGMQVVATKRHLENEEAGPFVQALFPPEKLHGLLPQADVLIVALPLTPLTENLIGSRELELLPQNNILINVGRAQIIDQEALYRALRDGVIGAAGLDVWYNYPESVKDRAHTPPADFPFWELENVVMSPHRAGLTAEIDVLRMDHLAVLLNAAAKNEQIPNKIDLTSGY